MQIKHIRRPGRPPSKHPSSADSRIIKYLALVAAKESVNANDLFKSLVKAWENQHSRCKTLSINCRKKTQKNVTFLITKNGKVVAQFPFPTYILTSTNPLKGVNVKAIRKRIAKKLTSDLKIGNLTLGMKKITLRAKVREISAPKIVATRFGKATLSNASLEDETGSIQLTLWNEQRSTVTEGDSIQIENAKVVTFRGNLQLRIGRGGKVSVIKKS